MTREQEAERLARALRTRDIAIAFAPDLYDPWETLDGEIRAKYLREAEEILQMLER